MNTPRESVGSPQPILLWSTLVLLVVLVLATGVLVLLREAGSENPAAPGTPRVAVEGVAAMQRPGQQALHLFYLSRSEPLLVEEVRWVPEDGNLEGLIAQTVAALAAGSTDEALISPLPPGARLLSCFYEEEDRRAVLDLSAECLEGQSGDTFSEWATIYSLVNSVGLLSPKIEEVMLLCEGEPVRRSPGNWDWLYPFKPDTTLVRYRSSQATGL